MITLQNVTKVFGTGVSGLSDINLQIDKGEFVFLVGHTGSGKTTLLRLLIKEVDPTQGQVIVGGWDLNKLPNHKIPHLRKKIGVVFQDLKLLNDRTIFENISLPLQVAGISGNEAVSRAEELLEHVGISAHRDKFPVQLSGGELQRAAIARALTLAPDILLADEPTGNLDSATAFGIVDLLSKINQHGTTIIMATHNMDIVEKSGNRVIMLEKGVLVKDQKKKEGKLTKKHEESNDTSTSISTADFAEAKTGKKEKIEKEQEEKKTQKEEHAEHKKHEHKKAAVKEEDGSHSASSEQAGSRQDDKKEIDEPWQKTEDSEEKPKKKGMFGGLFRKKK